MRRDSAGAPNVVRKPSKPSFFQAARTAAPASGVLSTSATTQPPPPAPVSFCPRARRPRGPARSHICSISGVDTKSPAEEASGSGRGAVRSRGLSPSASAIVALFANERRESRRTPFASTSGAALLRVRATASTIDLVLDPIWPLFPMRRDARHRGRGCGGCRLPFGPRWKSTQAAERGDRRVDARRIAVEDALPRVGALCDRFFGRGRRIERARDRDAERRRASEAAAERARVRLGLDVRSATDRDAGHLPRRAEDAVPPRAIERLSRVVFGRTVTFQPPTQCASSRGHSSDRQGRRSRVRRDRSRPRSRARRRRRRARRRGSLCRGGVAGAHEERSPERTGPRPRGSATGLAAVIARRDCRVERASAPRRGARAMRASTRALCARRPPSRGRPLRPRRRSRRLARRSPDAVEASQKQHRRRARCACLAGCRSRIGLAGRLRIAEDAEEVVAELERDAQRAASGKRVRGRDGHLAGAGKRRAERASGPVTV